MNRFSLVYNIVHCVLSFSRKTKHQTTQLLPASFDRLSYSGRGAREECVLYAYQIWRRAARKGTYPSHLATSGWRCTSACMARHRIICLSCVHQSLKSLNDSIFVPPAAIYSLFHGFSSIRTAVAPSLSLDRRYGTCSKTICVSRTCKLTVFVVHWRRFFLDSTRHTERIRGVIFCDDALYKLTFTLHYITPTYNGRPRVHYYSNGLGPSIAIAGRVQSVNIGVGTKQ